MIVALFEGMDTTQPMSIRDTAKGIAIRAGILTAGGLVLGAWAFGVAAKAASGVVKAGVGAILLLAGAGVATYEVKRAQRKLREA